MKAWVVFFCMISAALLLLRAPMAAEAATCNPTELTPCAAAILNGEKPTQQCCSKLKSQSPCFCQYKNDPSLAGYVTGGRKVAADCGVTIPNC